MTVGLVKLFDVLAVEVYDFRTSLKPSWCSAGFPQYLQHFKMSVAVIGNWNHRNKRNQKVSFPGSFLSSMGLGSRTPSLATKTRKVLIISSNERMSF